MVLVIVTVKLLSASFNCYIQYPVVPLPLFDDVISGKTENTVMELMSCKKLAPMHMETIPFVPIKKSGTFYCYQYNTAPSNE